MNITKIFLDNVVSPNISIYKVLKARLPLLGEKPICNARKDSAPHFRNYCFPLCWRCSGVLFSFLILNKHNYDI